VPPLEERVTLAVVITIPAQRAAAAMAAVLATAVAGPAGQQFKSGVEVVRVPVVVSDRNNVPVRGLTAEDFEVLDQGERQKVAYFTAGTEGDPVPLHLGLLMDTSDSMGTDLKAAQDAAIRFLLALQDTAEDTTFVDFDTTVRVTRFSPQSYELLFERIRTRKAKGFTALYDALGVYLESSLRRDGQHSLILYTDGGDTMSKMNLSTLTDLLRLGNVVVYAMGYLENQSSSSRVAQQQRLTQIARETGGEAFFPSSREDVAQAYERVLDDLEHRYTLGYTPPARPADGKFRKIEVRVTKPDLKGVKVRTRSGYLVKGSGNAP
jgi:Ca-activated chloride channel family protein